MHGLLIMKAFHKQPRCRLNGVQKCICIFDGRVLDLTIPNFMYGRECTNSTCHLGGCDSLDAVTIHV